MPRGAQKDEAVTKMLRDNGLLLEKRSFVSRDAHLYLFGEDKVVQRQRVFNRDRGFCRKCGRLCAWEAGEWHHVQGGLVGRCDCLHNAEWRCGRFTSDCHTREHVQTRFSGRTK
jgi:hypothetical protein